MKCFRHVLPVILILGMACGGERAGDRAATPPDSVGAASRAQLRGSSVATVPSLQGARSLFRSVEYDVRHVAGADSASDPAFVTYFSQRFESARVRKSASDGRTVRAWFIPDSAALSSPEGPSSRRAVLIPWINKDAIRAELSFVGPD